MPGISSQARWPLDQRRIIIIITTNNITFIIIIIIIIIITEIESTIFALTLNSHYFSDKFYYKRCSCLAKFVYFLLMYKISGR